MPFPSKKRNYGGGRNSLRNSIPWGKGHSSDSNPKTTKFRNLARNQFSNPPPPPIEIKCCEKSEKKSTEKMLKHDQALLADLKLDDNDNDVEDDDNATLLDSQAETADTKFSNFTNCTNPTFSKAHRLWKSGSNLQNDVLSVLAAVTEVIKKNGGRESESEYFAALLTSFANDHQSESYLAAHAYLLSLAVRKVPYSALASRFSQISQILYVRLARCAAHDVQDEPARPPSTETNALIRYLLITLGVVLKAQPRTVWESPDICSMLDGILSFVVDQRPKLRKTAIKVVGGLLINKSGESTVAHPANRICSKFATETIERCGGDGKNVNGTLHVLTLLQFTLHRFSSGHLKSTVETLLKLMTLASPRTASAIMRCFHALFLYRPSDYSMTAETNGQVIMALYDFEPSKNDAKIRSNWLLAITEAHACLCNKNMQLFASTFMAKALENLVTSLSVTSQPDVLLVNLACVKRLLNDCLRDLCSADSVDENLFARCSSIMQTTLSYQFMSVWPRSFETLTYFFEACQSIRFSTHCVNPVLKSMAELRESENFAYKSQLDKTLGSAIRNFGPERVLDAVPLLINSDSPSLSVDFPNSWLLPLLRKYISVANLKHFICAFLPTAIKLRKRIDAFAKDGRSVEAKIFEIVQQQIWDLLPSYCNQPEDLSESFKDIAQILGSILLETSNLRLTILSALRTLISKNATQESNRQVLAQYAKNYLPILINLYVSDTPPDVAPSYDDRGVRLSILDTIHVYLTITSTELIDQYFNVALKKLNDQDTSSIQKHRVLDILIALVKHLNTEQICKLFSTISPYCNQQSSKQKSVDRSLQKKAYRIFEELFKATSEGVREFMTQKSGLKLLTELLTTDFTLLASATKAVRLNCLRSAIENVDFESESESGLALIKTVLPDAVMCLKENNVKTRRCAARLLIACANRITAHFKDSERSTSFFWDTVESFFTGSVQQISCVLIAARLYVFEFKNDTPSSLISFFLSHVCRLLADNRRAVVDGCLEFLKTFVSCSSQITVGQYLDVFCPALFAQNADCRHQLRMITKKVLAKLIKRFSYETVRKFAPGDEYAKQLNYIRKMLARREKAKSRDAGDKKRTTKRHVTDADSEITGLSRPETIADLLRDTDDDESESEPEYDDNKSRKSSRKSFKSKIFIKEKDNDSDDYDEDDKDEDVIDLLDRKTASKLITGDSILKKKQKSSSKDHGFKTDKDGRLIIVDDDNVGDKEQENSAANKIADPTSRLLEPLGKRRRQQSEMTSSAVNGVEPKRHKVKPTVAGDSDDSDAEAAVSHRRGYKPGGKGIHRPLGEENIDTGGKFKSSKSKGDVKRKGQSFEPYAYIPLDRSGLNKRKRAKASGKFKSLVHGAKKGATKGSKGRRKK